MYVLETLLAVVTIPSFLTVASSTSALEYIKLNIFLAVFVSPSQKFIKYSYASSYVSQSNKPCVRLLLPTTSVVKESPCTPSLLSTYSSFVITVVVLPSLVVTTKLPSSL